MSKISTEYDKEVKSFVDAMKYKLHVNRHKGKWEGATLEGLFKKLQEEVQELKDEIDNPNANQTAILLEAADISNMALMIANVAMKIAAGEHFEHKEITIPPGPMLYDPRDEFLTASQDDIKKALGHV